MNILIINPAIRISDKPRHIPHGLAILASVIRQKLGITPAFLDINAHRYSDEEVEAELRRTPFDIVLIGGLIPTYGRIVKLSELIRRLNPEARIIAGGSAAMSAPEVLLKHSAVDIICTGEGEITIVELLKRLGEDWHSPLDGIEGICYKKNDGREIVRTADRPLIQDLDHESMLPAYDLLPMDIYLANPCVGIGKDIDFISSRGCPFQCSFCYQPWGRQFRAHSIDFVIDAIRHLRETYQIDFISFLDDEFMTQQQRVREFCEKRNRFFPDLLWSCNGRANIVSKDEETVRIMKESGCTLIGFGFESGSQRMLDAINKRQTIEQMEKTIAIIRKYELPIAVSFITGMPGENEESCQETVDFCLRNHITLDSLMFATPYPGSDLFDYAVASGRIDKNRLHEYFLRLGDARDFTVNLTDAFTDAELIAKRDEMMRVTGEAYQKYLSPAEVGDKMKSVFGELWTRCELDEHDLEHRAKHGGMGIF